MNKETRDRLIVEMTEALQITEDEGRHTGAYKAELKDSDGTVLGTVFGMALMLQVLINEWNCIDLLSDEAGGAVSVDLTDLFEIGPWEVF